MLNTATTVLQENDILRLNSCHELNEAFREVKVRNLDEYKFLKLDNAKFTDTKVEAMAKSLAGAAALRLRIAVDDYKEGRVTSFFAPRGLGEGIFSESFYPAGLSRDEYVFLSQELAPERGSGLATSAEYLLDMADQAEEALENGMSLEELWTILVEATSNSIKHCRMLRDRDEIFVIAVGLSWYGLCGNQTLLHTTPLVVLRS